MSKHFDYALSQVTPDVKQFIDNSFDVANQIHSILERQGKTQKDLAEAMGKSESEISRWLTGTHNFTLKSVSKIEVILGEKILTTPLRSQQDFSEMLKKAAIQFLNAHSSEYYALTRDIFRPVFVEISQITRKYQSDKGEKLIEQKQSYALVA